MNVFPLSTSRTRRQTTPIYTFHNPLAITQEKSHLYTFLSLFPFPFRALHKCTLPIPFPPPSDLLIHICLPHSFPLLHLNNSSSLNFSSHLLSFLFTFPSLLSSFYPLYSNTFYHFLSSLACSNTSPSSALFRYTLPVLFLSLTCPNTHLTCGRG